MRISDSYTESNISRHFLDDSCCLTTSVQKGVPVSCQFDRSACTGRTSILNGSSRDSLGSRGSSSGTSLPRCSTNAFEKDWICGVLTRSPFDSSAHYTTSKRPNNELLGTFFDAQEGTVQELVCDVDLLFACFQEQSLLLPSGRHGSRMRHALKCTLECSESTCALHGTGDDLGSETHTPRQRNVLRIPD